MIELWLRFQRRPPGRYDNKTFVITLTFSLTELRRGNLKYLANLNLVQFIIRYLEKGNAITAKMPLQLKPNL